MNWSSDISPEDPISTSPRPTYATDLHMDLPLLHQQPPTSIATPRGLPRNLSVTELCSEVSNIP